MWVSGRAARRGSSGAAARRRVQRSPRRALASAGAARHARAVPAGQEPQIDKVNPAGGRGAAGAVFPASIVPLPAVAPRPPAASLRDRLRRALARRPLPRDSAPVRTTGEKGLTEETHSDLLGVTQSRVVE